MHYYQFNIADYRKDTTHLSMLEHGAYRQLLDWHYLDQAPIPLETEVVFRRLSARTEEEQKAILIVLKELFVHTNEGYIQHRVMREIEQYQAKADRARDNGKLGGRPSKTKVVILDNQEQTKEKANSLTKELNNSLNKKAKKEISIKEFLDQCKANNELPIREDDPIFDWTVKANIPFEFLNIAWNVFKDRFLETGDKKKDWRAQFRNYVKSDWLKVWYFRNGECLLTTVGIAKQNELRKAA